MIVVNPFVFASAPAGVMPARYVRWTISKRNFAYGGTQDLQVAEFELRKAGAGVSWPGGTTVSSTHLTPYVGSEAADKLVDGNTGTKMCGKTDGVDWTAAVTPSVAITFDCGAGNSVDFDAYRYCTANDAASRDPVSWIIEVSNDGTAWTQIDARNDETIGSARTTWVGPWGVTLP